MILRKGVIVETVNDKTQTREMTEDEIKGMLGHLRFNTGMSLPDQLIHDFMSESRILPTFKKCMHFNRDDFNQMIQPLKHKKKPRPRRKSKAKAKAGSETNVKVKGKAKTKGKKTRKRR
jgi:hypothetical protein